MDALTISAASGLRARMESLDLLANNLANAATGGFKSDREFYGLYSSAAAEAGDSGLATVPAIEKRWTDFSQGTLRKTGNSLDLALSGKGFFAKEDLDAEATAIRGTAPTMQALVSDSIYAPLAANDGA